MYFFFKLLFPWLKLQDSRYNVKSYLNAMKIEVECASYAVKEQAGVYGN